MKRAEKMRDSSGIISRLKAKAAVLAAQPLSQEESPTQKAFHQETQPQDRLFLEWGRGRLPYGR